MYTKAEMKNENMKINSKLVEAKVKHNAFLKELGLEEIK